MDMQEEWQDMATGGQVDRDQRAGVGEIRTRSGGERMTKYPSFASIEYAAVGVIGIEKWLRIVEEARAIENSFQEVQRLDISIPEIPDN